MSKKKSFTTMTLKDFHGGSIPSELALPSAPGSNSSARPPDRPVAWGTAVAASGRSDHHHLLRPRPGSAGAATGSARGLDNRTPAFLSHPPLIGRHFDEDERKPFDASSAPRRAPEAPDNTLRSPPPPRSDQKRPVSSPVALSPVTAPTAAPAPGSGPDPVSVCPHSSGNIGSAPSAWGLRKDIGVEPPPPLPTHPTATVWSASRLAQASAVEKVSSGMWQMRPPEVEVIRSQETEGLNRRFGDTVRVMDDLDRDRERERPKSVMAYAEVKERTLPGTYMDRARDQERPRSPMYPEKERNAVSFSNERARPASSDGRLGASKLYQQGAMEVLERPKLNLLPRRKPLETPDIQSRDFGDKQVYQAPVSLVQVQNVHEIQDNINLPKSGSAGADDGSRAVERPKLNLKPRTQPIELSDGNADRERQTVFGGARPRELVLKERGVDVAANDLDATPPNRARNDLPRTDSKMEPNATNQQGERAERLPVGQKTGKDLERKGYRPDTEKGDPQRASWRNDNWKNTRGDDKPLEEPRADTDTWCKSVDQPKSDTPAAPRFRKAASALELAQAFSRSVSDSRSEAPFTSHRQRSIPGQTQVPFSRLTDTRELYSGPAQRQINGY